jgi:hypothetical protein
MPRHACLAKQVNGERVELEEVESVLKRCSLVESAAANPDPSGKHECICMYLHVCVCVRAFGRCRHMHRVYTGIYAPTRSPHAQARVNMCELHEVYKYM